MKKNKIFSEKEIISYLKKLDLFSEIDNKILLNIAKMVEVITLRKKMILFSQGDLSDSLYIVIEGELEALIKNEDNEDIVVGIIKPEEPVGEIQIVSGGQRTATVKALKETALFKISKNNFDSLVKLFPEINYKFAKIIKRRLARNQLVSVFNDLFGNMSESLIKEIEKDIEWIHIAKGDILFNQGEVGDSLFIVISGKLQAYITSENNNKEFIGEIYRGECVGEMALFTGEARSATIIATRDSELIKFSKKSFKSIFVKYPNSLFEINQILIDRLKKKISMSTPIKKLQNIVIIPISDNLDFNYFMKSLNNKINYYEMNIHLTSDKISSILELDINKITEKDPNYIRFISWLDQQETNYSYIIYQADRDFTTWTKLCIDQADIIVLVGDADGNPDLNQIEKKYLTEYNTILSNNKSIVLEQILVLFHRKEKKLPEGTNKWLEIRHIKEHYHIRDNNEKDFSRLARCLLGKAVGLVLSGGGIRGFSHLSLIQALDEENIPIDYICGVSMGSLMGAQYAMGFNIDKIARNVLLTTKSVFDLTLPIVSIAKGKKLSKRFEKLFKKIQVEDLWIPYFCVSTNLTKAKINIHRRGLLKTAVLASSSPPPLAPPVIIDGDLLYDGFILNNTPADVMRKIIGSGYVIAMEVVPSIDLEKNDSYGNNGLSGWRILLSKIFPFIKTIKIPDLGSIVFRSTELYSISHRKKIKEIADLYLSPPIENFNVLDFSKKNSDNIYNISYKYVKKMLAEWNDKPSENEIII